ncbi:glycoside hydrolase family 28 protein [Paraglaciecola hydrolytica]|uniref:Polygalacturonase n=1 Tax=Paraglaciecola hydrolytica TaxID=1799789 RepID=A0A148KMN6_9ALTE|nr:glycoside hydrolase family 28 protein [Paraglaciecola hydrolytica]KXI27576.1 polygalacturonase [Paraglaciecola hydrolytica]
MLATETIKVTAPFDMPEICIPDFSGMPVFNIVDFGAEQGSKISNNIAIANAIKTASEQGGGMVFIPEGEWLCGKIHLKSWVNLHVAEGATLVFSEKPEDYLPVVLTSWEGMECYNYSPLIYAYECRHVAITGKGKLKALMDVWTPWGKRPKRHMDALADLYHQAAKYAAVEERQMAYEGANLRPHFVQFNRCQHVLIEDIHIENSPFWVLHPLLCKDVVVRRVSVKAHGHNNDGIDPEMTQNMLIEDCIFDQGDDAIALKAGRNQDGWRLNIPSKNIVVRRCHIVCAHHLVTLGTELSAGIENVLIQDCQFDGQTDYQDAGNLLYIKSNERCGGYVKNIILQNIQAKKLGGAPLVIETDVLYQWRTLVPTYERRLTQFDGIHLAHISADQAQHLCRIEGQSTAPIKNVSLNNINIKTIIGVDIKNQFVEDFSFA